MKQWEQKHENVLASGMQRCCVARPFPWMLVTVHRGGLPCSISCLIQFSSAPAAPHATKSCMFCWYVTSTPLGTITTRLYRFGLSPSRGGCFQRTGLGIRFLYSSLRLVDSTYLYNRAGGPVAALEPAKRCKLVSNVHITARSRKRSRQRKDRECVRARYRSRLRATQVRSVRMDSHEVHANRLVSKHIVCGGGV
ncbi:hypothetical protein HDV57DRAFT_170806 [Trichoderma longibrachiatum]|uniref:Uncharacterized protein n=1 Tax=Trichoderma longibrachiatum ATCC 18648 TaxID=983965 RepID=A0A2T4CA97_TRILO|nr:hypothetical protein M440DRAFT_1194339 [Trichoderma longibrachiatum ATCC 18648]